MGEKDDRLERREFLRAGVAPLTGLSAASGFRPRHEGVWPEAAQSEKRAIRRTLGKTGIVLPVVSIGANSFDPGLYRAALEKGIRHVDTAPSYQNGNHERMLGQVFKGLPRDSFIVATSFDTGRYQDRNRRVFEDDVPIQPLVESFEGSLKRLGLEYVDIYYLAWMCSRETTLFEPFIEVMQKLKEEGKTRFIGVTTHENEPEVLRTLAETGIYDVVLTVYNFRQTHREEVREAIAAAARAGVGIIAMKTQAGASWDPESARTVNMSAALKWALQDENVHTSVPGITSFEQLEADLAVMQDLTLTEAEKADLERVSRLPYRLGAAFCQQCRTCVPQCPNGVDVPTLMRSYMYAYGYKNPAKAKEALRDFGPGRLPCTDCGACPVRCAMGYDVRARALDVFPLREISDGFFV